MTTILILFGVGILLLALELIVPGAILGILGAVAMLAGVGFAFSTYGWDGGLLALALAVTALGLVVYFELVWLPKSALARYFSMSATVTGVSRHPVADPSVVGAIVVAETTCAPSGYVLLNGKRFEASCVDGYAKAGDQLRVTAIESFGLVVTKAS